MTYEIEIREKERTVFDKNNYCLISKRINCQNNSLDIIFIEQNGAIDVTVYENFNGKNNDYSESFKDNGLTAKEKATKYCKKAEADFINKQIDALKEKGLEAKVIKEPIEINNCPKTNSGKPTAEPAEINNYQKTDSGKSTEEIFNNFIKYLSNKLPKED